MELFASLPAVLLVVCLVMPTVAVQLHVDYPTVDSDSGGGDYSLVRLSCLRTSPGEPLNRDQSPAVFLRNGSLITPPNSSLVQVTDAGTNYILFVFTQEQEGEFSCRTALGEQSPAVGLAGNAITLAV